MTDFEIGTYHGCTHGTDGRRRDGCIPCAINWHTAQQVEASLKAEHHLLMLRTQPSTPADS